MDTGDTKKELTDILTKHYGVQKEEQTVAQAPLRFRPPYLRTNKHDARGDAASLALEHMLQKYADFFVILPTFRVLRDFPLWAAYALSEAFVDHSEELQTSRVKFDSGSYEAIDAAIWCKLVLKRLDEYLSGLLSSPEAIPGSVALSTCTQLQF